MEERKEKLLAFMNEKSYKPLLFSELVAVLDVPKKDKALFNALLDEMELEGLIFKSNRERYSIAEKMGLVVGRLQGNERGYGFVIPDEEGVKDIFVSAENMNGAMNNDRVIAKVQRKVSQDKRAEGEILKITKRANTTIVGTFESSRNFGFVVPDDRRIPGDIFISKEDMNGVESGFKVVAEITRWPERRRNAEGKIIEIIGDKDEAGTDILSIIRAYKLQEEFPEEVQRQVDEIEDTPSEESMKGRRDLRDLRMVTIDGEDAKDLDDAVSVEKLPNGNVRLGVHIADVSHYVKENSPLDKEALSRGTSVYLVDRVIPMLPKKLSNGICSLNPKVNRLAFTVMMEIDLSGRVVTHDIFESVIHINERMTYTNVFKILVEKDEELRKTYDYLLEDFETMLELSYALRKKRMARGAIDFDFEEAKIILDELGKPIAIKRYEITIANKIIEEFMLACNETVAEHFYWKNAPFMYRVHENPDPDKIAAFAEFAHNLGYTVKAMNNLHPRTLQDLVTKVKGTKEERIISTIMLRSLQKAKYSHQSLGHFGLAAEYYSHFTSPIRRYPDLIIHRIMKEYLIGDINEWKESHFTKILPEVARICSERERASEEAERETEDLKKVEYMKAHEGEDFDGIISNITNFGMFVELDNTIEGLVRMSNMEDDYYVFDEKHYHLIGERTRKIYRIGDEIRVNLARADITSRQIDFVIVNKDAAPGEKRARLRPEHRKTVGKPMLTDRNKESNKDGKSRKNGKNGKPGKSDYKPKKGKKKSL